MANAAQGNPVIGENVQIVFQMLADLRPIRVFQQGAQLRQYLFPI